jgi:hypothetical protein
MVRQNIIAKVFAEEAVYLTVNKKQRKRESNWETWYNLQSHAPVTYFLQLCHTS